MFRVTMILWFLVLLLTLTIKALDNQSLVAVHLIFRHGDRCPEKSNLYAASEYYNNESYFMPFGFGQLTNKGKLTAYRLGQEVRTRYNGFLDDMYNIYLIKARSSDFNRTKASLQAMLAGLFPPTPELTWSEELHWQPIATTYVERSLDKELFCFGCPSWDPTIEKYMTTSEGKKLFSTYSNLLEVLTNQTGEDYKDILKAYYLYFGFEILEELKLELPIWSKSIYPEPLKNLTLDYYDMITATPTLRQMAGGYLLKHILSDTDQKISGKIPQKKMFLWCGHENNIAAVLRILGVWKKEEVATYGSYIALELHQINETYGFQIIYKNTNDAAIIKLPACDEFCPLDSFKNLVQADIPIDDSVCSGATSFGGVPHSTGNLLPYIIFYLICFYMYK